MRKCFWLQRKSMWRSRTDSLAMKGLTKRRGIKRLRKGAVNSGSLQTWKVPDQYNLIVALNPLMSWQDVASLSVKQSFALCYALHPLCRQAAAWSWRRSEAALLDLNNLYHRCESLGQNPFPRMWMWEGTFVSDQHLNLANSRKRTWGSLPPAFNAPLQTASC